jgi:hypothetical protein
MGIKIMKTGHATCDIRTIVPRISIAGNRRLSGQKFWYPLCFDLWKPTIFFNSRVNSIKKK